MKYNIDLLSITSLFLSLSAPVYAQSENSTENRINSINESYQLKWADISERSEKIKDEAPEGAENAIGVDLSSDMVRYDFSMDIPEITMELITISLDLPQVTMKRQDISWDNPETFMETTNCGWYPEFRGFEVKMSEIRCDLPQIRMVRREASLDIPEFKFDRTEIKMHVPQISMETQRIVFDLPRINISTTSEKTERMEALSNEIASESTGLAAQQTLEIKAVVLEDLVSKRSDLAQSFNDAEAKINDSILSVENYGIDPSAVKQEDGSVINLYETLSSIQVSRNDQLAKIDEQILEINRI